MGAFIIGAALPLGVVCLVSGSQLIPAVALSSLGFLAVLGVIAAQAGGTSLIVGAIRVTFCAA